MSKSRIPGSPGSSRITTSGRTPGAAGSAIKSKVKKSQTKWITKMPDCKLYSLDSTVLSNLPCGSERIEMSNFDLFSSCEKNVS